MRGVMLLLLAVQPAFASVENAQISLSDRSPVSLRGLWEFSDGAHQRLLRVDKEWRLQGVEKLSKARFTLGILIPRELRNGDFALILPPVSAAVRIFLNEKLIAEKGIVDARFRYPQNSSEAFSWYPIKLESLASAERQSLTLEITGFQEGVGVYGNAHIYFGGIDEVKNKYNFIFLTTAFIAAAIFMIGVFHFALVPDRNYRRANLHYVLLSLAMSCHVLGMNGLGYHLLNNFVFNAALIHIIVAAFPFALVGFSLRYFQLQYPLIRKLAYYYGGLMAVVLISCALLPDIIPLYLRYGLPVGVAAMTLSLIFAIFAAVKGVAGRIQGAPLVLSGFLVYGGAVLNDVLFYFSNATSVKLADGGFLFAVICIALALAQRLQRSSQEKSELRDWQKELKLAAQIQRLALPARKVTSPYLQISTLFKPMKIIGGDFFAFHEISPAVTGVFIADVSGHGIAAALLVNTINTVFVQQRHVAKDPALLMQNMNTALFPHLKEQFITAAYCVIDGSAGKIRIAQAGHPPIYLLRRGEQALLRAKPKGRFFGFDEHLFFETEEYELRDFQRIFLYSDGVIEAGAIRTSPYSVARLENFLLASTGSTADGLLNELERDILKHTSTPMNTDDDSSCVVVDLLVA